MNAESHDMGVLDAGGTAARSARHRGSLFHMPLWARWRALDSAGKRLHVRALAVLWAARLRLSVMPFPLLRAWAAPVGTAGGGGAVPGPSPAAPSKSTVTPAAVDRAIRAVARFVPRATCLARALAAQRILGRAGVRSELRIGVATGAGGALDAHAWLECADGTVVGDPGRPEHRPLPL